MPNANLRQYEATYRNIARAIDAAPMTAPKVNGDYSPAFLGFLAVLYTPEEAEILEHLSMPGNVMPGLSDLTTTMRSAEDVAVACGKTAEQVSAILDPLASSGGVMGIAGHYGLLGLPLLVNRYQFTERLGSDDLEAARLYQQFFIDEKFYKYYQSSETGTQVMRVIPVQRTLRSEQKILDTEESHKIIDAAADFTLVPCPCRTRAEKMGARECKNETPIGFCIMMDTAAMYFQTTGQGRQVGATEAKKYFDTVQDLGLVGTTENYDDSGHNVICLCCRCCCSQTRGRTRWANPEAIAPANFVAESSDDCLMCGKCVERCMFGALALDEELSRSVTNVEKCMGCGVCTITCDQEALRLVRVERNRPLTDANELSATLAVQNRSRRVEAA